jgi:hypothetical protein
MNDSNDSISCDFANSEQKELLRESVMAEIMLTYRHAIKKTGIEEAVQMAMMETIEALDCGFCALTLSERCGGKIPSKIDKNNSGKLKVIFINELERLKELQK